MGERIKINTKKPLSTKENSAPHKQKTGFRSQSSHVDRILFLQRTIGNQAVQRLIRSDNLQAKLMIGQPGDKYEQEADRVAEHVIRMPEPQVQRQPIEDEEEEQIQTKPVIEQITPLVQKQIEEEEEEELQVKATSGRIPEVQPNIESHINSLKGGGQPLSENDRAYFEPRFGHDFSQVRVHNDTQAAESARAVNARAFTVRQNVVFGEGEFEPGMVHGKRLIAHELTHVIQQSNNNNINISKISIAKAPDAIIQRDIFDSLSGQYRDVLENISSGVPGAIDPIEAIFDTVVNTNRAIASGIPIPNTWLRALVDYSSSNLSDGVILLGALGRYPRFFRGGWIMDLQPNAAAMTLDHSIFVPASDSLSLSTYIHELVHVMQCGLVGVTGFLVSYFGLSAATIAYRWLRGLPTNSMRSSPHEEQAYNLEDRFSTWYQGHYHVDPDTMTA